MRNSECGISALGNGKIIDLCTAIIKQGENRLDFSNIFKSSYLPFAIIIAAIVVGLVVRDLKTQRKLPDEDIEKLPYRRKFLLTKNEYWFYKSLKEIADKYGFAVLAKIRFADLVEVSAEADKKEYMKYFGKIKSKHIDFILCKKDNLYPELLIELNDSSHNKEDRIKRDKFVKKIAEKVSYKMVFVDGTQNLEETIIKALEIKSENNNDPPIDAN